MGEPEYLDALVSLQKIYGNVASGLSSANVRSPPIPPMFGD